MTELLNTEYDRLKNVNLLIEYLKSNKLIEFDDTKLEIVQSENGITFKSKVDIKRGRQLIKLQHKAMLFEPKNLKNINLDPMWKNCILKNKNIQQVKENAGQL